MKVENGELEMRKRILTDPLKVYTEGRVRNEWREWKKGKCEKQGEKNVVSEEWEE